MSTFIPILYFLIVCSPYAGRVPLQARSAAESVGNKTMKAIVVEKHGGPEVLTLKTEQPIPAVKDTQVENLMLYLIHLPFYYRATCLADFDLIRESGGP